jgi:ATP-dependent helicase/nuclease subunit A
MSIGEPRLPEQHPIVARMRPSPEQERAICVRDCDVVVTAGAGTGKTRTLVARYLALLAEGLPLRSVIAITFTRKAAREMRNRAREEMRRYLARPDLGREERDLWQGRYRQLDAARIGTIHSLCTEILRAHPAEAQVDPRFGVLDEGPANLMRGQAIDEALAWATDDAQVVALFDLLGGKGLRDTLDALVRQRLAVADCPAGLGEPLWPQWEATLLPPIQAFVEDGRVRQAFDELLALRADGTLARAEALGDGLAAPLRRLLELWEAVLAARERQDWAAVSARLAPLRGTMKQAGRAANWQPADPKALIKELQEWYDAGLAEWVGKGINLALDRQLAEAAPALRRLFEQATSTYRRLKEERQALDFDDLESAALTLLQENPAARSRWQAEVNAVLVDEFQDTNARQRDLVAVLNAGGGKLFIVGDAKQSIYRFRGADVTVFRAERERIEREGGRRLPLATSYRAHRHLIDGLNVLLRPVLGEQADPARPWVEPFAGLGHHRQEAGPGFVAPHIELHLTVGSKTAGALDRAARALAGRIVELVEGGLQVDEDGQARALNYGDVAILCRASTSFGSYEDALEQAGVPFLTVAGRGFYGRPEIRDLLNGLGALADPGDDLALAGLLRSPACALSDEALYRLCQGRDQAGRAVSLWRILQEAGAGLPGEDGRRAGRAVRLIADLHGRVGRTPVADVIKAFLDATDYRPALMQTGQSRGARNLAKLLADAHASGLVGMGEFLEYIKVLRDSGAREGEARATAEGAVQIMSVHAAKGLEFPVVAIGDATYGGGGGGSVLIDPEWGVLLELRDEAGCLPAGYRLLRRRADDQEEAESDRLLYVAATRAREKLLVNGCISLKQDGTPGRLGGWLGKIAGASGLDGTEIPHNPEGADVACLDLRVGQTPIACTVYEPGRRWEYHPPRPSVASALQIPVPPPLLAPVPTGEEQLDRRTAEQERVSPERVWRVVPDVERARAPAWVIGSLVHEALAAWSFPDGGSPASAPHSFERWAEARARAYGLTDRRQLEDATRQSRQLLLRFRAHALYREMDGADRRLHEVPYSLVVDGRIESGIIDALYLRSAAWTIVEFKTDRVTDRTRFEELLAEEDYLAQAQRYLAATERLLGQRPRCVLCMLNYAGAIHLETDLAV